MDVLNNMDVDFPTFSTLSDIFKHLTAIIRLPIDLEDTSSKFISKKSENH